MGFYLFVGFGIISTSKRGNIATFHHLVSQNMLKDILSLIGAVSVILMVCIFAVDHVQANPSELSQLITNKI